VRCPGKVVHKRGRLPAAIRHPLSGAPKLAAVLLLSTDLVLAGRDSVPKTS
jgi:hypothetical protein